MKTADRLLRAVGPLPGPLPTVLALVQIKTELYGDYTVLLRKVNSTGAFLETADLLPLGTIVRVGFVDSSGVVMLVATGKVQSHYYANHADSHGPAATAGMAVRFTAFHAGEARAGETSN